MYNDPKGDLLDPLHLDFDQPQQFSNDSSNQRDPSGFELAMAISCERRCEFCREIGHNCDGLELVTMGQTQRISKNIRSKDRERKDPLQEKLCLCTQIDPSYEILAGLATAR